MEETPQPDSVPCENDADAEMDIILDKSVALRAGVNLCDEEKYAFYIAITKAYLQCGKETLKKSTKQNDGMTERGVERISF